MNGEHPWYDWFRVLVIFLAGLIIVMIIVRLLIKWAQRNEKPDDEHWREVERARGKRDDDRPEGRTNHDVK